MMVLGGDVYELNGDEIIITYDSWSFSGSNFIKSFEKASEYINNYYKNNGDNFIYTLIVSNANVAFAFSSSHIFGSLKANL